MSAPTTVMTTRLADLVADAEQQRHEAAGTGHLREQVEEADDEGRGRGGDAHRALLEPERQHVGHRELARVAQQLGDEQQRHEPRDEEADRVEEPVVAGDRDRADDAEERRRRQVVARDRGAVLAAGERAAGGVVVGRGLVVAARAEHDDHRDRDERAEDGDVEPGLARRCALRLRSAASARHLLVRCVAAVSISSRISAASGSSCRLA